MTQRLDAHHPDPTRRDRPSDEVAEEDTTPAAEDAEQEEERQLESGEENPV